MCFSSISITEITIKHMLGRLSLPGPETFPGVFGDSGLVELSFRSDHAMALLEDDSARYARTMDAQHTTHRTDAAPAYTAGSLDSAAQVLQQADGSTPAPVLSLTDEQLAGMDGDRADQLTALPWLAENTEDIEGDTATGRRAFAAGVGLRSLVASGLVRIVADPAGTDGDGTGSRWQAVPVLDGCLVLRRAANMVTSVERTMNTPSGPQVNRLYYYTHPSGVLEEEVTASGIHHFTPLRPEQAPERISALVDPAGVAGSTAGRSEDLAVLKGSDGGADPRGSTSAAQDLADRLAGTLAMSVVTVVRAGDGGVEQRSLAATATELLLIEGADAQVRARVLDAEALRELAVGLVAVEV